MLEKDFDQFVRDQLEHHPSVIPDDMWQKIKGKEKKDRGIFLPWKGYLPVAAALLAFCLTGYILFAPARHHAHPAITGHTSRIPNQSTAPGTPHSESVNPPHPASASPFYADPAGTPNPEPVGSTHPDPAGSSNPETLGSPRPEPPGSPQPTTLGFPLSKIPKAPNATEPGPESLAGPNRPVAASQPVEEKNQYPKSDRPLQPLTAQPISHKPPTATPCPDPNKKYMKDKGWYLEGLASPDYAFISQQPSYLNHEDRILFTYTAGIRLVKVFPSGLSAMIGLQYSRFTIRNHYDSLPPPFVHLKSIDLPLLVGYEISDPRTKIGIHGGVIVNLHSFWEGYSWQANIDQYDRSSTGISTYLGLDFIRQWNDRFSVFVEPYYKHQLSPMLKQPYSMKIDVVGLFIGVRYTLKQYGP